MIQYSFKWQRGGQRICSATFLSYATYQSLFSLHQVTISNKVLRLKKKQQKYQNRIFQRKASRFHKISWYYEQYEDTSFYSEMVDETIKNWVLSDPQSLTVRPQVADRMWVFGYNTECLSMDHNGYIVCRVLRSTHVNNHFVDFSKGGTVFVFIHSPW